MVRASFSLPFLKRQDWRYITVLQVIAVFG